MKSDRRHELQQNELAVYLGRINRSIEPYSRGIAVVVGTVIVAAIAYGLYSSKASGDRSDATLQLIFSANSRDAESIAAIGDSYPQTAAGIWARLYEADQYLAEGMRGLYQNRSNAQSQLDAARSAYRMALASGDNRLLRSRAHFGLARVAESLGEIDEAIAEYGECIAVNESKAMVELAQQRIDALSKPDTKEFLAWFSEQDFSPADPSLPPSLPSGATLPDLPDLDLPDLGNDEDAMELKDGGITLPKEATEDSAEDDEAEKQDTQRAGSGPPESDDAAPETNDDSTPAEKDSPPSDQGSAERPGADDPS